jgi:D-glycero-alpha-D-manno-heptose-7-phosphate kinase
MYEAGIAAGAWGGKLLGAGSGGFLLFMCPPERRAALRNVMQGRIEINFEVDYDGSKVVLYQPDGL